MLPNGSTLLSAGASLVAVLALIMLCSALARSRGLGRARPVSRRLNLAETIAIDARRRLHLVECDGGRLILLTGGAQDLALVWGQDRTPGSSP